MTLLEEIESKLKSELINSVVQIIDNTHLHAGHSAQRENPTAKNLEIHIHWPEFKELSRINRERKVQSILKDFLESGKIHAMKTKLSY